MKIGENPKGNFSASGQLFCVQLFLQVKIKMFCKQPYAFVAVERTTKKSGTSLEENQYAKGYAHLTKILKAGSPT